MSPQVSTAPGVPAAPAQVLLLPGWQNSGPGHWQSRWESAYGYIRVEQHDWLRPLRGDWVARLEEVLIAKAPAAPGGFVLVAHSLGCLLVAAWASHSRHVSLVRGALLVAPADLQSDELAAVLPSWSPPALQPLPFASQLLASRDDPYCSMARSRFFADAWGSELVDCGARGHLNADSGLGAWDTAHRRLGRFSVAGLPSAKASRPRVADVADPDAERK